MDNNKQHFFLEIKNVENVAHNRKFESVQSAYCSRGQKLRLSVLVMVLNSL